MKLHMALLLYALASTQVSQTVAPTLTTDALTSDRVAIYREFLTSDSVLSGASALNVSLVTEPFLYKNYVDPDLSCLSSAHIFELSTPQLHKLPSEAFVSSRIHLVDLYVAPPPTPAPGHAGVKTLAIFHRTVAGPPPPTRPDSLVTMSEIVFDDTHTHAAFRYSYTSGPNSAKGATAIYDLEQGNWKASKSTCSEWSR